MKCICCGETLLIRWCDTHGVGVCTNCAMPYSVYHYDGDGKRIEKEPTPALHPEGIAIAQEYWAEKHAIVFPAAYDLGFGRSGQSYSGATKADVIAFNEWCEARGT